MKLIYLLIVGYFLFGNRSPKENPARISGTDPWEEYKLDSIQSPMDGHTQKFHFYKSTRKNMPLVVSLHQWSSDYSNYKNSLAPEIKAKDWNYIYPDFRGANNHVKACGSRYVISDIDEAIEWAVRYLPVDTNRIYIVGASGGGYAALCHFMKSKSKHHVKEYSIWVPITDLRRWYNESKVRGSKYAGDIIKCTCSGCDEPDFSEADKRSPLYNKVPVNKLDYIKVSIYAGIHDGFTGAVPIAHSLLMFNKLTEAVGGTASQQVSCDDMNWMLTTRSAPGEISGKLGDRDILYSRTCKNISLTVFEGTHEILVKSVFP